MLIIFSSKIRVSKYFSPIQFFYEKNLPQCEKGRKYKNRDNDRQFTDLKKGSKEYLEGQNQEVQLRNKMQQYNTTRKSNSNSNNSNNNNSNLGRRRVGTTVFTRLPERSVRSLRDLTQMFAPKSCTGS